MTTPDLTLFHFPSACSRVSVCALEMAGLPYTLNLVNLSLGEQTEESYKAVSALGKVPALLVDGEPMLENAAIITFIHALAPQAGILPSDADPRLRAEGAGGLSFCGGTLHPQVRGLLNPQRITTGDGEPVRERSRELAAKSFAYAERRLAQRGWWLGEQSIVDVYVEWAFGIAQRSGLAVDAFPRLKSLGERLSAVPAYARMLEIERKAAADMKL